MHRRVLSRLREAGYDVEWISDSCTGASDVEILNRTDIDAFVLVTHDGDFGDLIFNQLMPQPKAILYIRLPHSSHALTVDRIVDELVGGQFEGMMVTITKDNVRRRRFPELS